jgi:uncharacterized protein YebE (UPF0316 family)
VVAKEKFMGIIIEDWRKLRYLVKDLNEGVGVVNQVRSKLDGHHVKILLSFRRKMERLRRKMERLVKSYIEVHMENTVEEGGFYAQQTRRRSTREKVAQN